MKSTKKVIAFALVFLLCMHIAPVVAFAEEYTEPALNKATGYQDFPAYYSDSTHADNQVTHPDVVVLDEAWNGYRYWAVYTPNVMVTSAYENPSIVASNDGVTWVEPEGISNPIEPQPVSTRYHNCDADMIYNPEMNAMMAYWNWADDQAGGVGAEVRLRISYDGIHWGVPVTYNSETRVWTKPESDAERQVAYGDTDYIVAVHSSARYDMLSPTFVYDDFRDVFIMWSNNTGDVGYNNGQSNYVEIRYSQDGISWGEPTKVNNWLNVDANGNKLAPWHQDVNYISELKEFIGVAQCFTGNNPDGSVLHLTKSKDGVNWEQIGTVPLLSPGESGSWDDFQIYRSCFYYDPGDTYGSGTMRVWYSALQANTTNQMVADSSGNLTIQALSADSRIWRIGYAENSYVNMMKALLNDSTYTVPALISGTSMSFTSDVDVTTLPVGEKAALSVTFAPADASDQVVKYTSSDSTVATVDENGVVTAVGIGTATISGVTREDVSATITVTVVENHYQLIPQSTMTASATSVYAGSAEGPAANVLDGNINTIWHTNYNPMDTLPQSLTVTFSEATSVGKYVYTPRQVGTNGMVTQYELYATKADGTSVLVTSGTWDVDTSDKIITFDPVEATALELKVIGGSGGYGTAAEINVYEYVDEVVEYTIVDDRDSTVNYTGTWNDDSNSSFHDGTARYTNESGASVSFTFTGTAIQWYGQHDTNFGTANVYIDDELMGEVNAYGTMASGQLLFEKTDLTAGQHTIQIVQTSATIDVDFFAYAE